MNIDLLSEGVACVRMAKAVARVEPLRNAKGDDIHLDEWRALYEHSLARRYMEDRGYISNTVTA